MAAIQGRLDITVDCDFGNQTAEAIRAWQTERGDLAVTGQIGVDEWTLLDIPTTWGTDTNGNGTIEPSEVTLVCDGNVELPAAPVDTTGWPDVDPGDAGEVCGISSDVRRLLRPVQPRRRLDHRQQRAAGRRGSRRHCVVPNDVRHLDHA